MRISVFGLGYVGSVCAACLANRGHKIIAVDTSAVKINFVRRGQSPIIEPHLEALIKSAVDTGNLDATSNASDAVSASDLSLICVGTPTKANGFLDLQAITDVATTIGRAISIKNTRHTIVVRSTVVPGTTRDVIVPHILKASNNSAFGIGVNPEFMREGAGVSDFNLPAKTVVGTMDDEVRAKVLDLYCDFPGPKIVTDIETAELLKYVDNAWHALKVAFANEIGVIGKSLGINSHDVMDAFVEDTRLNISAAYLRPGFAFGGSCLPKDLRALSQLSQTLGLSSPVITHILDSNRILIERGVNWILDKSKNRIAFLGISFKSGTDDMRESPFIELVERLSGKGREIRIFDQNVHLARLIGANKEFLNRVLPHVEQMLVSNVMDAIAWADAIVVTTADPVYSRALCSTRTDQIVLDFAGVEFTDIPADFEGFLW